ncbi:hypothetical protein LFYK43_09240 [Ligilactobacillus salitolerans]|uniref:DUF218 domain-containing protein n=1 Tax=Ligilactobacillus salitolerans TaxID=1808352 RepID=A0A401ISJ7_9LACO|nr:YdcF family protein [Ligilactobacillus salitolerans]GBG94465.1 hypothetical protein LFYK43_09240 [Ligilactobacillus salitolerans]
MLNSNSLVLITGGLIITVLSLVLLAFSLRQNKFRLLNGVLGNLALLSGLLTLILAVEATRLPWLNSVLLVLLTVISVPLLLLYSLLGVLLLWNAWTVWHKESHTLGNMLTLFLGLIFAIVLPLIRVLDRDLFPKNSVTVYQTFVLPVLFYAAFWFLAFITSFLITRLYRPGYNQEYIIVLGAGLLNGDQVSPLLGGRIQVALNFAAKQFAKNNTYPLLVFSGGQGGDETIPEGVAMKRYALLHGAPADKCLAEDKSKNTYENMQFSKQILLKQGVDLQHGLFATSDYHTFRAAGYARFVGLKIDGLGAKTSKFFIPNAFIREYIALLANHKKVHAVLLALILLFSTVSFIVGNGITLF